MQRLMEDVRKGTLDYVLTKPEDPQLLVSVRDIRIWQGVEVLTGAVVLGYAVARDPASLGTGRSAGLRRRASSSAPSSSTASG